jgi:hypothetical protein
MASYQNPCWSNLCKASMEIVAPCFLEVNGAGGQEGAAPTRNDARGQERAALEGDGARGGESIARESNGAGPGAPATQIQETRADRKTCHQVSELPSPVSTPFATDGSLWV